MNIEPIMKRRLIIGAVAFIAIVIIVGLFTNGPTKKPTSAGVPDSIIKPVTTYIQAHEDAIGADQTSPTSWLDSVKSVTTIEWFKSLQPSQDNSTGSASFPYTTAHENDYKVVAKVSDCNWVGVTPDPDTATSVKVLCSVYDSVTTTKGDAVPSSSLPYGWSSVGQQAPVVLSLVKHSSSWLVSDQPADQQTE
jgi:hypothetical protein